MYFANSLSANCARLRRDVRQVRLGQRLPNERQRLDRIRLRRRRFLPRHIRSRHRHLVNGKEGRPRIPIENEGKTHLGELHDGITRPVARPQRHENRRGGIVVVPDVVVHGLVVPFALAGRRIESEHAVREQVVPFAEASVKILGGRTCCAEHPAAFLIDRHAAPRVRAAVAFSLHPLPGVMTRLPFPRNGVKDPLERPGDGVVGANMAGRCVVTFVDPRAHDQEVLVNGAW